MPESIHALHARILRAYATDPLLHNISRRNCWRNLEQSPLLRALFLSSLRHRMLYPLDGAYYICNRLSGYRLLERSGRLLQRRLEERGIIPKSLPITGVEAYALAHLLDLIIVRHECDIGFVMVKSRGSAPVIFDCGANFGVFTLWAKMNMPGAEVFAFEPVSRTCDVMRRLVGHWNLENVHVEQKGVGARPYSTNIYLDEFLWASSISNDRKGANKERITIVPIDGFVRERKVPHVDFVKIDVEGVELDVIKGMRRTAQRQAPVTYVAGHHRKSHQQEIPAMMRSANRKYTFVKDEIEPLDFIFFTERR
jgi:FkbM family methyltransferase